MLKGKRHLPTYNDGVADIYREKDRKTDFSARRNPRKLDDMDMVARLYYEEMSCRDQDFEFASQRGFTLSKKIRAYCIPDVDSECRVVIDGDLYSIGYIDRSKNERVMYVYMTSVGKAEVPDDSRRD